LGPEEVSLGGKPKPHAFLMCIISPRTQLWGKFLNAVEWAEASVNSRFNLQLFCKRSFQPSNLLTLLWPLAFLQQAV